MVWGMLAGCWCVSGACPDARDELAPAPAVIDPVKSAQRSREYFFDQLRRGGGQAFYLRVTFENAQGKRETLWVSNVHARGDRVTGKLTTPSKTLSGLKPGSPVRFRKHQVVDWIIVRQRVVLGGFTEKPSFVQRRSPALTQKAD